MTQKLSVVTTFLVKADQVGYVRGRQSLHGTRRMLTLLKTAVSRRVPSVFLTLNAEKAFDRVHWGYLKVTLMKFGLVGPIYSTISALYTVPSASVYTCNAMSDTFAITTAPARVAHCPL